MPGPNKRMVTIAPGVSVEGIEIPIVGQSELWSTYTLEDGTTVRMKHAVTRIFRLVDRYGPDGDPVYVAHTQPVVVSDTPPNLKHTPPQIGDSFGASLT